MPVTLTEPLPYHCPHCGKDSACDGFQFEYQGIPPIYKSGFMTACCFQLAYLEYDPRSARIRVYAPAATGKEYPAPTCLCSDGAEARDLQDHETTPEQLEFLAAVPPDATLPGLSEKTISSIQTVSALDAPITRCEFGSQSIDNWPHGPDGEYQADYQAWLWLAGPDRYYCKVCDVTYGGSSQTQWYFRPAGGAWSQLPKYFQPWCDDNAMKLWRLCSKI